MTDDLRDWMERHRDAYVGAPGLATGGTTYANPLSLAAACRDAAPRSRRRTAFERAAALGARLADGIEATAARHGLPVARAPARRPLRLLPGARAAARRARGGALARRRADRHAPAAHGQPRRLGRDRRRRARRRRSRTRAADVDEYLRRARRVPGRRAVTGDRRPQLGRRERQLERVLALRLARVRERVLAREAGVAVRVARAARSPRRRPSSERYASESAPSSAATSASVRPCAIISSRVDMSIP